GAGARIVRQSPFLLTEAPEVAGLPVDPEDLLAAGDGNVKPLEARHAAASLQADLGAGLSAGVEAYWKEYRHLLQWDGDAQGGIAAGVRDTGTGRGRGVELSVRRDGEARRVRGWMTLSLSSTKKAEGPSAEMRPADQDRPWMVQAAVDLPIRGGTSLSFGYRAAAGRPITPLVPGGGGTLIAGEVNSTRLPDYHRFDVKLEHRIAGKGDGGEEAFLYLDVLNLFNQKNVVDVVQYVGAGGTPARIEVQGVRILPIAGFGFYF
ncbi:MAG: TonB-dependent receptor, partial [Candidatus Eisenbacteria bacterium]|nr:TonB-dependent receptor [Candidatus Eisenbacteria bacterium]